MVTMNKPAQGNTSWYQPVTDNWTSLEKQVIAFQGRMQRDSTTQVSLQRYQGDTVDVNGESVSLGSGGIALATTDNLINSTGGDTGGSMAINTLYYVYLSNSSASTFATDLRASTTAPSSYNGVKYLGTSGNAANWRFVGYVRTISNAGTPNFADSETQRLVINYYNRRALKLRVTDSTNNWTWTTNSWESWNSSTSNRVEFISNNENSVEFLFCCSAGNSLGRWAACGIGLDSTNTNSADFNAANYSSVYGFTASRYLAVPSEGYHYLQLLQNSSTGGTTYWYGDDGTTHVQNGASGYVMG